MMAAWSWWSFAVGFTAAVFSIIGVGVVAVVAGSRRGGVDNGLPPLPPTRDFKTLDDIPPKPPEPPGDPL